MCTSRRIAFLNTHQVAHGSINGVALPDGYKLACAFFHCGMIDRTGTLDQGFPYQVLDPIPRPNTAGPEFAELCDARGETIVTDARSAGKEIAVLWSGGIDSTCALIAIIKAAATQGYTDRIAVLLSASSVQEYPGFFLRHIDGRLRIEPVTAPVAEFLDPARLNVTGEHGDQLFGSQLLRPYVQRGLAHIDYREVLPLVLLERLRSPRSAIRVWHYLNPVIAASPVPLSSLFDCMWWFNFALKWQEVSLRLALFRGADAPAVIASLRHFFRDNPFQQWALANTPGRPVRVWTDYKTTAKAYIHAFTGDDYYYQTKEKEDSLRNVMANPAGGTVVRAFMREDLLPVVAAVEQHSSSSVLAQLRARIPGWPAPPCGTTGPQP